MNKKLYIFLLVLLNLNSSLANIPKTIINEIFTITKDKKITTDLKLQRKINSYLNFSAMSNKILENQTTKISKKDIIWFKNSIKKIITKSIYPDAPSFFKSVSIQHEAPVINKNITTILSIVTKRDEETEILTTFSKDNKRWKIIDIAIDDESWTENIQEQVNKNIQQKGWKGLKQAINKKIKELNKRKI